MKYKTVLVAAVFALVVQNVQSGGEQSPEEIEEQVGFFEEQVAGYLTVTKGIEEEISNEYAERAVQVGKCKQAISNVTDPAIDGLRQTLDNLENVFANPPKVPEVEIQSESDISAARKKRQMNILCLLINDKYQNISATLTAIRSFKANLKGDLNRIEKSLNETISFLIFFKFLLPASSNQIFADVANSLNLTIAKINPKVAYVENIELISSEILGILTKLYTKWCFSSPYALSISECQSTGDITASKSYCFVQKAFTWLQAYDFCYYRGMNLFTIQDTNSQIELSKAAKNVTSAGAKLWINGQFIGGKWFSFSPRPAVVFKDVEWLYVAPPDSGCMEIIGTTDGTGSFSADSGDCLLRHYSFCEFRKVRLSTTVAPVTVAPTAGAPGK